MFSLAKEILEAKARGEEWDWEDFEAVMELMEEEAAVPEGYSDQTITSSATDTGLSVPDGYFDGLAERTMARVRDSQTAVSEAETPKSSSAIRTRVRCVNAMWATKDKRVRKTLKKICK